MEELEHDYEKKNAKPLQSAYFIILIEPKTVTLKGFSHQRGDMQNLQPMTFNSFIHNIY